MGDRFATIDRPACVRATNTRCLTGFSQTRKTGIVREFCKPGKVREKSGNFRYGQGIFYDMSHGSRLAYRRVDLGM